MNLNKNYYNILNVKSTDDQNIIKKSYYKLSLQHHPDRGGDPLLFSELTEAYNVLCGEEREDYDIKSKFGNNYNEYFELFEIDFNYDYNKEKSNYERFKKNEILDIYISVDDEFNGTLEYERWVKCKICDGTGKDLTDKIIIKDINGNILKTFDSDDGCDYCEGTGKDFRGNICNFCRGAGKIGLTLCKKCNGERRIFGKQKLSKIKLTGEETRIESMGNCSKDIAGLVGSLIIKK